MSAPVRERASTLPVAPAPEAQAYLVEQFRRVYPIGRVTFYKEVKAGRLRTVKVCGRTMVTRAEAERWFAAQSGNAEARP